MKKTSDINDLYRIHRVKRASHPLVSVILTTYNRPDMVGHALSSVAAQTYPETEIIVVNDGGDDVGPIVQSMGAGKRVVYLRHERNSGVAAARNTGLRAAGGKYIAYLDDDDRFYPDHIETLVRFLENSPYAMAYTDAYRAHQVLQQGVYRVVKRDMPYSRDFDIDRLLCGNFIPTLCVMHEKACVDAVGGFDERLQRLEDWDLWIRLALEYPVFHLKKTTAEFTWRKDGSSMTSGQIADFRKCYESVCAEYQHLTAHKPALRQIIVNRTAEFYYSEARQHLHRNAHASAKALLAAYRQQYGDHPKLNSLLQDMERGAGEAIHRKPRRRSISIGGDHGFSSRATEAQRRFFVVKRPKSALICVTYGQNWQKLSLTLDSIYRNTREPYHLFLVDNACTGKTLELYQRTDLPHTTLIRNPENIWWGGGINQGIRMATADVFEYLFFLNDDIQLPAGWLDRMTAILSADPVLGAVGPLNSSPRDWQGYDNVRRRHTMLRLPAADGIDRLNLESMNQILQQHRQRWCYIDGMLAFFCTGFKRKVVEAAGYLDPDFFDLMCGDDNAYCMEIRRAGYKLALALDTYVLHHSGSSVNAYDREKRMAQKKSAALLLKQKYPEFYGPMVSRLLDTPDSSA